MGATPGSGLGLDLSGLCLNLSGLPAELASRLSREWPDYVTAPLEGPFLRLAVALDGTGLGPAEAFAPKAMRAQLGAGRARFTMPEGSVAIDAGGTARIRLRCAEGERAFYTLLNLLRASLAWSMPSRGGALLHAAGMVLDGRAFVLVGSEGSGKSTWAELGEAAGAHVVSDDLLLVDGIGPRLEVLGSPFRSTYRGRLRRGRWPLAAILFPRHGAPAALSPVAPLASRSRLLANLPFVAEGLEDDPRLAPLLERLATEVDCRELTFALDGEFVALLRGWETGGAPSGRAGR